MSEEGREPNPFFELDPNRPGVPNQPLLRPVQGGSGPTGTLPRAAVYVLSALDIVALAMICFGSAMYLSSFVDMWMKIPLFGVFLLLFVFLVLPSLQVIWDHT